MSKVPVHERIRSAVTAAEAWKCHPDDWEHNTHLRDELKKRDVEIQPFRADIRAACGRFWPQRRQT